VYVTIVFYYYYYYLETIYLTFKRALLPPPATFGIQVNYGPVSRIPLNFELESRILIHKKV